MLTLPAPPIEVCHLLIKTLVALSERVLLKKASLDADEIP
jgi:hypothetical protein